jgi:hypothetical protein
MPRGFSLLLLLVAVTACSATAPGSNGDAGAASTLTPQERAYCDGEARISESCAVRTCESSHCSCMPIRRCILGRLMIPRALDAYVVCRTSVCMDCEDAAARSLDSAAAERHVTSCTARQDQCQTKFADLPWVGSPCGPGALVYPGLSAGIQHCITGSCDGVDACVAKIPATQSIRECLARP